MISEGSKWTRFLPNLFCSNSSIYSSIWVPWLLSLNFWSNEMSFRYLCFSQNIVNLADWTSVTYSRISAYAPSKRIAFSFIFFFNSWSLFIFYNVFKCILLKLIYNYLIFCIWWSSNFIVPHMSLVHFILESSWLANRSVFCVAVIMKYLWRPGNKVLTIVLKL